MPKASGLHSQHKTTDTSLPLVRSFERHLRAERKDPDTIAHYIGATQQFLAFCEAGNLPPLAGVSREHVEMWLEALHERYRPHTVRNRYIGLRIFFKWLAEEGEIDRTPMARIRPPSIEESPKDIAEPEDVARVLAMLEKAKRWRDCVIVGVLYDTGMRAGELADTLTKDVDLDKGLIMIPKTKANRVRIVRLSPKACRYVDRYWRRPRADPDSMVCGPRGRMTRSGIYWAVRRCFEEAGVKGTIGAHDLRHTSASHVAADGLLSESDAMELYGWTDPEMWRHYTAQARRKAALDAHTRASPLERLGRP